MQQKTDRNYVLFLRSSQFREWRIIRYTQEEAWGTGSEEKAKNLWKKKKRDTLYENAREIRLIPSPLVSSCLRYFQREKNSATFFSIEVKVFLVWLDMRYFRLAMHKSGQEPIPKKKKWRGPVNRNSFF